MTRYNNILVIQTAFIGDAILASGLLEKLHATFPQAAISVLVRKGNESIYNQHPFLKDVLIWDKQQQKLKHLWQLVLKVRGNRYDCVVNCHRFASSGLVAAFSGAPHIAGFKQNPFSFLFNRTVKHIIGDGRHETERYNQLVEDFAPGSAFGPKLYPSAHDYEVVKAYKNQPYVCMAPASVWFTKQLPETKWVELCKKIPDHQTIYLLGAPTDEALCQGIAAASRQANIYVLAGKLTLLQSCALMQHAAMNYVNDSAPLHLASAVNAPVTAYFLSTIPEFGFGPLSGQSIVKQVNKLPCRPCGLHGHRQCPKQHFDCGLKMEV